MSKIKRILALVGVFLLVGMYGSTLIFALSDHPDAFQWLIASVGTTIIVPVFLYGGILVHKYFKDRNK